MYYKIVILAGAEAILCLWLAYTLVIKSVRNLHRAATGDNPVADWVTIAIGLGWGVFQIIKMSAMLRTML